MADRSAWKILYGIVKWSMLAVLIVTLVLLLRKSTPPDVPYDANAGARVEQKFAAAQQAKAAGEPAQVALDRTELNSYLHDNLVLEGQNHEHRGGPAASTDASATRVAGAQSDPSIEIAGDEHATLEQAQPSVRDLRIDLDGDLIKVYALFDFHGKDLSLELEGHLGVQDGYIKFDPVAGKLGSLPLPQSTLDAAVERLMSSPENREKLKLPPAISDIQVANGQAVITYR